MSIMKRKFVIFITVDSDEPVIDFEVGEVGKDGEYRPSDQPTMIATKGMARDLDSACQSAHVIIAHALQEEK